MTQFHPPSGSHGPCSLFPKFLQSLCFVKSAPWERTWTFWSLALAAPTLFPSTLSIHPFFEGFLLVKPSPEVSPRFLSVSGPYFLPDYSPPNPEPIQWKQTLPCTPCTPVNCTVVVSLISLWQTWQTKSWTTVGCGCSGVIWVWNAKRPQQVWGAELVELASMPEGWDNYLHGRSPEVTCRHLLPVCNPIPQLILTFSCVRSGKRGNRWFQKHHLLSTDLTAFHTSAQHLVQRTHFQNTPWISEWMLNSAPEKNTSSSWP